MDAEAISVDWIGSCNLMSFVVVLLMALNKLFCNCVMLNMRVLIKKGSNKFSNKQ